MAIRQISECAKIEIELLRLEGIDDLTPDEVVEINEIAQEIDNPTVARIMARGIPVKVGGAWLWPLTMRATEWFNRVGCNLPTERQREGALGYAMAHGYSDGTELYVSGLDAAHAVTRWLDGLACTMDEYRMAAVDVQNQTDDSYEDYRIKNPNEPQAKNPSIQDISATMVALCGGTPDQWERGCANHYALAVLQTVLRHAEAKGKSSIDEAIFQSQAMMGVCVERIRQKRKAAQ